jgi:trigger factor
MTEKYKKIAGSKATFSLVLEKKDLEKAQKKIIEKYRKNLQIKGFRKGSAPDDMVLASIGDQKLMFEGFNLALDLEYRDFIIKNKLKPVSAPKIDFSEMDKIPVEVKIEVEIFPEIILGNYEKLKIDKPKIVVSEDEISKLIESFLSQSGKGSAVFRASKKGDLLDVNFLGKDEKGKVLPNTEGKNVKFTLGSGQFLPDLEKAYIGMKAGEEKKNVKVDFPKDYPAPEMAGKKVPFDIKLNVVSEISAEKLDEKIIEEITGKKKTVIEFRKDVKNSIENQKTSVEKQKKIGEYEEKLAKIVKIDLPVSWIENETEMRLKKIMESPQYKHDPEQFWKQLKKDEESLKKEFRKEAEIGLKVFLAHSEIVIKEGVKLTAEEKTRAHQIVHERGLQENNENHDLELQKAETELKIDKYLNGLIL